jgi:cyclic pyranopterin phosphate synthase
MNTPIGELGYLRFVLHGETDGILLSQQRPVSLAIDVPETREIRELLRIMAARGARKIRLVGEDPALREDLADLVSLVAGVPDVNEVALTTRGRGMAGRVEALFANGLRTVNIDLDTLRPERYEQINGRDGFGEVWEVMQQGLKVGMNVKLNTVLQRGINTDEIDAFIDLTVKHPIEVRFIEWNACADRIAPPDRFVPTWEAMAAVKPPLTPREPERYGGPAMRFGLPGHKGVVGFIPNVTEHFCAQCNRLGLTDYGEIVSCVFGRGLNLVRHLRSAGGAVAVDAFVDRVWRRKATLAAKLSGWETMPATPVHGARV